MVCLPSAPASHFGSPGTTRYKFAAKLKGNPHAVAKSWTRPAESRGTGLRRAMLSDTASIRTRPRPDRGGGNARDCAPSTLVHRSLAAANMGLFRKAEPWLWFRCWWTPQILGYTAARRNLFPLFENLLNLDLSRPPYLQKIPPRKMHNFKLDITNQRMTIEDMICKTSRQCK
jgi:hypothetical protein